jgi:hypothetical protein
LLVVLVLALPVLWGTSVSTAAIAHGARARSFQVSYTATGSYTADTLVPIACGDETQKEDTHFSWATQYGLALSFGRHGFGTTTTTDQPSSIPGDDNSSTVMLSGCAGDASCHGDSEPAPGNRTQLKATGASAGGRSTFTVGGVGADGIKPTNFSGTWSEGPPGSCAGWARESRLVAVEYNLPAEVLAKFPVKYSTLKSLPVGHYFKVHISAGHYALPKQKFCDFQTNGCKSETFAWTGVVRVKRIS